MLHINHKQSVGESVQSQIKFAVRKAQVLLTTSFNNTTWIIRTQFIGKLKIEFRSYWNSLDSRNWKNVRRLTERLFYTPGPLIKILRVEFLSCSLNCMLIDDYSFFSYNWLTSKRKPGYTENLLPDGEVILSKMFVSKTLVGNTN